MKIALYGGAFDPCHVGHVSAVSLLLNSKLIDQVWIVPSGDRPDKSYQTPGSDRFAMTVLAIKEAFPDSECVSVLDYQCGTNPIGFSTFDLVSFVKTMFPQHEFVVVVGSELVADLPRWNRAEELRSCTQFLVIERPGFIADSETTKFSVLNVPHQDGIGVSISSTKIRAMLERRESVAGFVPPSVMKFIKDRSLYGNQNYNTERVKD